ncbi:MAG: hypothetical protein ACYS30_19475 [Planctomycetota bacterium]|jgi:hypothetical protein
MAQKVEQKVQDKKVVSISSETKQHLEGILQKQGGAKNKFGHYVNRPGGFIDPLLEQGKNPEEIVAEWSKQHPDKTPITAARVVEQAKHLLTEHNVKIQVDKSQPVKGKKAQG